jgi:hypothetical protein
MTHAAALRLNAAYVRAELLRPLQALAVDRHHAASTLTDYANFGIIQL